MQVFSNNGFHESVAPNHKSHFHLLRKEFNARNKEKKGSETYNPITDPEPTLYNNNYSTFYKHNLMLGQNWYLI